MKTFHDILTNINENGIAWYDISIPISKKKKGKQDNLAIAKELFTKEIQKYEKMKKQNMSSDDKYLATMIKSGTLADRIASTTLTIQASPLHNLQKLGQLITMAKKKSRRESQMAIESLKDLFINTLLPDNRKLTFFQQNANTTNNEAALALFYVEHSIKQAFAELLSALENGMKDAVENHKRACMHAVFDLLSSKPEQEAVLLSMLVNKLGDPERKIASKAMVLLQQLLDLHPVMKQTVASEVERLLSRANGSDRVQYNAVLFLNQLYLSDSDEDAAFASHLISVYFSLFNKTIKDTKSKSMGQKLLSALLTGVNRAFPYARVTSTDFQEEINQLFRVIHQSTFHTSIQALMLLYQVMNATNSISDRFYSSLYSKLLDPSIRDISKHTMFLNLLYRAIKNDISPCRSQAFVKRLLQISTWMSPAFICAILFLISELFSHQPLLRSIIDSPEEHDQMSNVEAENEGELHPVDGEKDGNEVEEEDNIIVTKEEEMRSESILNAVLGNNNQDADTSRAEKKLCNNYDLSKRNPLFAGAETSCAWELRNFLHHYHPSVVKFAKLLIQDRIHYAGDPLSDFTLIAFLEKMVNKKAKQKDMPIRKGHQHYATSSTNNTTSVYSEKFIDLPEEQIEESDRFFYTFFKEKAKRNPIKKVSKGEDKEEEEEMDAFAQQLAEGLLDDDFDSDPIDDLSDDSDEEEDESMLDENIGQSIEAASQSDANEVVSDDESEEEAFDFNEIVEVEEEEEVVEETSDSTKKKNKRKSPFASADDYSSLLEKNYCKQQKKRK